MVTLDELTIETNEGTAGWTATSTAYPDFTGAGATEQEAKEALVAQINEANPEEGAETESPEATEG